MADEQEQKPQTLQLVEEVEVPAEEAPVSPPAAQNEDAVADADGEEQDTVAARRAAIFDEDEDEDQDALPTFRRRAQAANGDDGENTDAAVLRKKKKKRYHSPSADTAPQDTDADQQAQPDEDPYSNMTEAERKYRTAQGHIGKSD